MDNSHTAAIEHKILRFCLLILFGIAALICTAAQAGGIGMFNDPSLGVDVMIFSERDYRVYPYVGALNVIPVSIKGKNWSIGQFEGLHVNGRQIKPPGPAGLNMGESHYTLAGDKKVCQYADFVSVSATRNGTLILYAREVPAGVYECGRFTKVRGDLGFGVMRYLAWREQFVLALEEFQTPFVEHSSTHIDTLLKMATDSQNENRQFAIITLASYGKTVVPTLVPMLQKEETASTALAVLQMIGPDAAEATLEVATLLTRKFADIDRRQIFRTLENNGIPSEEATSLLLEELRKITGSRSHGRIFRALVKVGPDDLRVHEALVNYLKHSHYTIRVHAAIAIGNTGHYLPDAVPLLKRNRTRKRLGPSANWALCQMRKVFLETQQHPDAATPPYANETPPPCRVNP
ncbi:MAG: HEAT repeat domain-containing protein [Deltaproteobacteria bacterium]|nr:HEAT repeat domain-containing protein [Deltaproteobacteria bacterium]